jgi:hypothetical protein
MACSSILFANNLDGSYRTTVERLLKKATAVASCACVGAEVHASRRPAQSQNSSKIRKNTHKIPDHGAK